MFTMFKQFFSMFATLFSAGEKLANSLNTVATLTEEMAEGYVSEERLKRAKRMKELQAELEGTATPKLTAANG